MNVAVKISESSDPVLISDKTGKVIWHNDAAGLLKPGIKALDELIPSSDKLKILNNTSVLCQEVDLSHIFGFNLKYSMVSCQLGSGEPDDDFLLIILKAADYSIQTFARQENNLSSVAHDLKNPLGAIFGYADALIDTELGSGLTPKHKDIVSRIRSTAIRSIELVRNLQQLSNLHTEENVITERVIDINQTILNVYKGTWRENINKPKVNIKLSQNPLPTNVERILVDRVISNLYSNALKFTPPEGLIELCSIEDEKYVVFEISNSLPLISPEELTKIFESRYRAKNSSGTAGTGIGLYIVKEIMKKISGKIEVQSSTDKGTVFSAFFPKAAV